LRIVERLAELRQVRTELASPVGLVPTMGYLHAGHASLMRRARTECASVIVTLFVNPAQFGPNEDFARYPRDLERDRALCEAEGADLLYAPSTEEVYPEGFSTSVDVGEVSTRWEGEFRPGHFRGVATVVTKLFTSTRADRAYFGEKDYQQLQVVKRLARDLDLRVDVVGCPTIREVDGLALSSRNAYLNTATRPAADAIYRGLSAARLACQNGERDVGVLRARVECELIGVGMQIDYVAIVDPATLQPLSRVNAAARVLVAARHGPVRLIDNMPIEPPA
jgi:pantoate--beta-alanine ligase